MTMSLTRSFTSRLSQRRAQYMTVFIWDPDAMASMAIGPVNWSRVASPRRKQLIA
jgi:hypothetical protein